MRLTVLGCSGSMPSPTSAASSYLLQADDADGRTRSVLLDLGSGAFGPLQRHLDPHEIDAVLLSHLHPDHCADVTALAVWLQYGPGSPGPRVLVYGPEGTAERLAELSMTTTAEVAAIFDVRTFADGVAVEIAGLQVTPHAVLHPVPAFGVRIVGPREDRTAPASLGYTGDTDHCDGALRVAADVDLLLAEAAFGEHETVRGIHLTGSRAGAVASDGGARRLVLTHLQPWADADAITAAAAARFDGELAVATPGATFEV
ncbi:MBL fold metallo-hydrolase [Serinibacter arcticus]|uniref:MBL fold metallo-hydrolase n=1 Tax=Serinibacter arcticus TaxID=1655435 RepID=A0A2U1ZTB1_9MICO|nr:MBL fold metallo-hydrolase [Serinibacter arcticus]PWD50190.1 MBL fold metallo-hydrolase [Serinibacter arcticus]